MRNLYDILVQLEEIAKDENMSFDELLNELNEMYILKYKPFSECSK